MRNAHKAGHQRGGRWDGQGRRRSAATTQKKEKKGKRRRRRLMSSTTMPLFLLAKQQPLYLFSLLVLLILSPAHVGLRRAWPWFGTRPVRERGTDERRRTKNYRSKKVFVVRRLCSLSVSLVPPEDWRRRCRRSSLFFCVV